LIQIVEEDEHGKSRSVVEGTRLKLAIMNSHPTTMRIVFLIGLGCCSCSFLAVGQQTADPPVQPGTIVKRNQPEPENKRILGVIPNYRTSPSLTEYKPLTPGAKFVIATQDSFDRGTVVLAAAFAGQAQLTNSNRSFGQGAAGYGRYFGTAYADFVIGNYMTEAIYPTLLHQDPRYFRRGTGSGWSRLGYAIGQTFWTHSDTGRMQFNYSEFVGNSTAVAISNAYYQDNRDASSALGKLGVQVGVDLAANVLKEFSSDLNRRFFRKHRDDKP
jgi:hypothetical protein